MTAETRTSASVASIEVPSLQRGLVLFLLKKLEPFLYVCVALCAICPLSHVQGGRDGEQEGDHGDGHTQRCVYQTLVFELRGHSWRVGRSWACSSIVLPVNLREM